MIKPEAFLDFLHNAHIFASTVQEILEEKYLRQTTDLDITLPQFNLIRLIAASGDHQLRQIASFLGVSQAAASKNVDKLVRLGLIARQVQPDDRRAASLSLTVRGKNVIRKYEAFKQERLNEILTGLAPGELQVLTQGLEKVSRLILAKEQDSGDIWIKCNAYYVARCPLRGLSNGCIYARGREEAVH